jgi:hypothetical protein
LAHAPPLILDRFVERFAVEAKEIKNELINSLTAYPVAKEGRK